MKNQKQLIIGLVLLLVVVLFALANVHSVDLNFGITSISVPLILLIVVILIIGAVLGMLVTLNSQKSNSKEVKSLKNEVKTKTNQLNSSKKNNTKKETKTKKTK